MPATRPARVVLYGVGHMAAITVEALLERRAEIVGAIARSPAKVGRDLGDVIGLGRPLGVVVSDDADAVLATTRPDVALLATTSYLIDHADQLERCIRAGVDVVTIAEECFHPWRTSPAEAARLDGLARAHGVSILGTGHEDAFWLGLGLQAMGSMTRVDGVAVESLWNPDGVGIELLEMLGIGEAPGSDDVPADPDRPSFAVIAVDALAEALGLDGERTIDGEPVLAEAPIWSETLGRTVEAGQVIGVRDTVAQRATDGRELRFAMTGRLLLPGESSGERWELRGKPSLRLESAYEPEQHAQVAAAFVHRIPDVVAAAPGWLRAADLPLLRPRARLVVPA